MLDYFFLIDAVKGIVDVLCEACEQLKWKTPTKIQREAIPVSLQGTIQKSCQLKS
jgi:superfamily II DNA/RNA helicase